MKKVLLLKATYVRHAHCRPSWIEDVDSEPPALVVIG